MDCMADGRCHVGFGTHDQRLRLSHTVKQGDTMWKLAVKYQIGTQEIITANPQITNPNLIYPGQVLTIPEVDSSVTAFEAEVIRLVNEIRQENGLKALKANWELSRVARYKSQDMLDHKYFSHTSPTYGSPFQMIQSFGLSYRTAGENIAKGYSTPAGRGQRLDELKRTPRQYFERLLYADRRRICKKRPLLDA